MTTQKVRSVEERLNAHVEQQLTEYGPASTEYRLAASGSAATTQQPYAVFVVSRTGQDLNGDVFYLEAGDQNVREVGRRPVPNNAQTGFRLGGPTNCDKVAAYRLILDDGTQVVGDTGVVAAHQNSDSPCADAYVIQKTG
jgi:hypothetical protein